MQYFKGDDTEIKFDESAKTTLDNLGLQFDDFLADAYNCQAFGDILYDNNLSPLANAIKKEVYRTAFNEVFANFIVAGTFESYIAVFGKVFGAEADVTFTVPAAGRLQIGIVADGIELSEAISRTIVDNEYVFDEIVGDDFDNIMFQTIKGFQSQYELEQMLFEMVPQGVFTEITLTLG